MASRSSIPAGQDDTSSSSASADQKPQESESQLPYPQDDRRPDLVFGLIAPIGCDLDLVQNVVSAQLSRFGYAVELVKITNEMRQLEHPRWKSLPDQIPRDEKYDLYMDAGNCLREFMGRKDAMAMLAVKKIAKYRHDAAESRLEGRESGTAQNPDHPGFIVNSLKTPGEVLLLRAIYGDRFIAISVYSPLETRRSHLARIIAKSRHRHKAEHFLPDATRLMLRDQEESDNPWGQELGRAFPLADIFIDASNKKSVGDDLRRAFDLLFDNPFITPTPHEYAMALAQRAAHRSADLSRQVGAAITMGDAHAVAALGTNEVPRSGGGQYWPDEGSDDRDFQRGEDTSVTRRRTVLADTVRSLLETGWLPPNFNPAKRPRRPAEGATKEELERYENALHTLVDESVHILLDAPDQGAVVILRRRLLVQDIIEFGRAVHAEMAALMDAASRGVSIAEGVLYTTDFPCHECARHIIAAGISEVQYIQPYPKSLVEDSHSDAIVFDMKAGGDSRVLFRPFVGIAPRRFDSFFSMTDRKNDDGTLLNWDEGTAHPREEVFGIPQDNRYVDTYGRRAEYNATVYREGQAVHDFDLEFVRRIGQPALPCLGKVFAPTPQDPEPTATK